MEAEAGPAHAEAGVGTVAGQEGLWQLSAGEAKKEGLDY